MTFSSLFSNKLKRKRRHLEKKALRTDFPIDWNNYDKVCNQYSALIKSARVLFIIQTLLIGVRVTLASYFMWLILCPSNHW